MPHPTCALESIVSTLPRQLRRLASCVWLGLACSFLPAAEVIPAASLRFAGGAAAAAEAEVPDFQKHVDPLLGRLGCNGRACHGSFQGRGGMQLSLFGYDFQMDHAALTGKSESENGFRIDRQTPDRSLILLKPTEQLDHEGGLRFASDSWEYNLLRRWVANGAAGTKTPSSLKSLEVEPRELNFAQIGEQSRLTVTAVWEDGSREDVTCLCRFRTNDDSVAVVDAEGNLRATGQGGTHLIVFYDNGVTAVSATLAASPPDDLAWPLDPPARPIDQLVNSRLRKLGLVPSPICSDTEFLRRLSIDLTGSLPTPEEVLQFLDDPATDKRERKIDELLSRPTFAAWWANKLCDFTGCNPNQQAELGQELAEQWYMWIYARLLENTPYDEIAARILLATSRAEGQGYQDFAADMSAYFREQQPADFSQRDTLPHYWSRRSLTDSNEKALAVAHTFLGIRLQCAQCHKHPWDQWTQSDFQQFAAFFGSVKYGVASDAQSQYAQMAKDVGLQVRGNEGAAVRADVLTHAKEGRTIPWRELYIEPRNKPLTLSLLRSGQVEVQPQQDPRQPIVDWMRDPQNPWFARAIVNRVWASCFHMGIVDPADDLNAANPPSNPELLDWLSQEFIANGYDLKWLLREITRSSAWQRSSLANASNAGDQRGFSRMIPRRIPAEVVYDGLKQVLVASDQQQQVRLDLSRRAVGHLSMRMAGTYAMHVFGKPERAVTCDCERVNEPTLLQAVFMQNDPLVQLQLADSGWIAELEQQTATPTEAEMRQWIQFAWLRALARPPKPEEIDRSLTHLQSTGSTREGMTDLLWSLLNTKEFLLNH